MANVVSRVLNPFLVLLVITLVLSFESTPRTMDALKWSLLLVIITILPVYIAIIYLLRVRCFVRHFIDIRQKRNIIYAIASISGVLGLIALLALSAPPLLLAAYTAGISTVVMFMGINFWWKISVHTAFVAGTVTFLIILYGAVAAVSVVLLPLVSWSRLELAYHSVAQVILGALLASLIVIIVFNRFGLVTFF